MIDVAGFCYRFPVIRGIQACREYYVSMCPLKLIPKLFHFDDVDISPEMRAQRILNKNRIPAIASYIVENKDNYTFSALTASIDGEVSFAPYSAEEHHPLFLRMGTLSVSMDSHFIINDGQHRRAAIEEALKRVPELENETIAVVFFIDRGLSRCQQMFTDLNRYSVRPTASIGILFDSRDQISVVSKYVSLKHFVFATRIEMEKGSIAPRSKNLFTLAALNSANKELLADYDLHNLQDIQALALRYWTVVAENIPEWVMLSQRRMVSGVIREGFVHGHSVVLQAVARVGRKLLKEHPTDWETKLKALRDIDWRRENTKDWEGIAIVDGKMCKSVACIKRTADKLCEFLEIQNFSDAT